MSKIKGVVEYINNPAEYPVVGALMKVFVEAAQEINSDYVVRHTIKFMKNHEKEFPNVMSKGEWDDYSFQALTLNVYAGKKEKRPIASIGIFNEKADVSLRFEGGKDLIEKVQKKLVKNKKLSSQISLNT